MPLRFLPEVPDGSVSCGADPAQCAGVKVHLSRNLSISGVVSSQRGEGSEDHRVLLLHVAPWLLEIMFHLGLCVASCIQCDFVFVTPNECVSELCGSGWEPGQLLRACLPQSRENTWFECGGDHKSVFLAVQFLRAGNF